MSLHVQGPRGGPDVTRRNRRSLIYITTDDTVPTTPDNDPNGSTRFRFKPGDLNPLLELKTNGVYNLTGLRLSPDSIELGLDMLMSGAAGFVRTFNPSAVVGHTEAFLLHIESTEGGTMGHAHAPILNITQTFIVFPGPATAEVTGTTIGQLITTSPRRLLASSIHEVGSIGATSEVEISFYKGTDNTGILFNQFKIPASDMVANQPLIINYKRNFGFEGEANIFQEFVSTNNISLKTNAGGDIITDHIGQEMAEIDIVMEELVLTNDLSITFGNDLSFVTNNRF